MKTNWQTKKIGEILKLEYGKPLPKEKRSLEGKHPVYGANGEKDRSNDFYFDKPSIIVGRKGSAGELTLVKEKFWPLDVTYFVTFDDKKYDLTFLYHLLETLELTKLAKGVKPGINRNEVYAIEVNVPPLPEQERIIKILDEAFEKLEKAKQNAENNLSNSKELFESYTKNVFKKTKFNQENLNNISQNLDNKRIPITKRVRSSGEYPYYGASGIVDYVGEYIFDENLLLVSEDGANLLARTYPIAFSISGKTWVNNHAHVLKFKEIDTQKFVEYYLNSIKLDDFVSGMAQPKLNQKMLNSILIPYPSLKKQKAIVKKLDQLSEQTKKLESIYQKKLSTIEELKKSILRKAFSKGL
ncbi:MAG: restriction endonuclease subunit S [Candidatus Pacebacteria bacterium]|nr:restriction endonuclease subunit S [Candidatus Paceibacterota bacterium]